MPYLTGFADEAADRIEGQIRATRELGWRHIEARKVDGRNLCDLEGRAFEAVCGKLESAGVRVDCLGSAIANWSRQITDPMSDTLEEVQRAIPRMKRLGTPRVRVMSYAILPGRGPEDQMEEERFRRLREIVKRFADEGLEPVHENCMNYGGMGWPYTLRLLEQVPGLRLVFDTGNPVASEDMSRPAPRPRQSSWEFYSRVRGHVSHVHIKDGIPGETGGIRYTYPGEGHGDVRRIVADLLERGYDGGFSIEPHLAAVAHEGGAREGADARYASYVEYGRRFEALARQLRPAVVFR